MAVLDPRTRSSRTAWLLLGGALGALAGCVLLGERRPRPLAFSHRIHVLDEGLDCITCHEDLAASDEPGFPSPDVCALCHDEIDTNKPPERQVASLFDGESFRSALASALASEAIFSHQLHVSVLDDCAACHRGIEANEKVGAEIAVSMQRCMDCHTERSVSNECATCHSVIGTDWPPANHLHDWKRHHGRVARADPGTPDTSCGLCHRESTCIDCHQEEPPANHTSHWRLRGHGRVAVLDRDNCAACHRPDYCIRCHEDTRPLSHSGTWGGTRSMHCLGCHFPLGGEGCVVCHKDTPSHALATPKPPWHTPAMNCRQCHGFSLPLPHVDKGDDCNTCHL